MRATAVPRPREQTDEPTPRPASRVGRPPRVQAPDIIAAAIDIGLEKVTLKQVADRLGVGIATLYRHVRNRDELVRLAAFRIALASRLPLRGAASATHWSSIAEGYAETLFESFTREPQLIHELMKGRLGPDVELDFLEQFLAALEPHGFDARAGVRLHHAIGMLAMGAALAAASVAASAAAGVPQEEAMHRALAEREASDLPRVRSAVHDYVEPDPRHWLAALRLLLVGVAHARGESLPASASPRRDADRDESPGGASAPP